MRDFLLLQLQQHPALMLTQTGAVAMGTRICAQMHSLSEEDKMGLLPGEMGVLLSRGDEGKEPQARCLVLWARP